MSYEKKYNKLRNMSNKDIAIRLKEYRFQKNYTQNYLAELIGVHRITLLKWENEQARISNIMLKTLIKEGVL